MKTINTKLENSNNYYSKRQLFDTFVQRLKMTGMEKNYLKIMGIIQKILIFK
jgi:hypothetical protein